MKTNKFSRAVLSGAFMLISQTGWAISDSVDISVGTRVWLMEWKTAASPVFAGTSNSLSEVTSTGYEAAPMPTLSLGYKDFYVTGSYLATTGFNFPLQTATSYGLDASDRVVPITGQRAMSAERSEWDVQAGYYLPLTYSKLLAVQVGYKQVDQNFTDSYGLNGVPIATQKSKASISGPLLGLTGKLPVLETDSGNLYIYGTYSHGFLSSSFTSSRKSYSADYNLVDVGLSYSLGKKLMSLPGLSDAAVYAGYRIQWIDTRNPPTSLGRTNDSTDVTQGFTGGVNITF